MLALFVLLGVSVLRGMCGKGAVCSARGAAKLKKAPSGAFQEVKQLALMLCLPFVPLLRTTADGR